MLLLRCMHKEGLIGRAATDLDLSPIGLGAQTVHRASIYKFNPSIAVLVFFFV